MINRPRGTSLRTVIWGLEKGSKTCQGRCKSTKSAIHAALQTPFRYGEASRGPSRFWTPTQHDTGSDLRVKGRESRAGRFSKPIQEVQNIRPKPHDSQLKRGSRTPHGWRAPTNTRPSAHDDGMRRHNPVGKFRTGLGVHGAKEDDILNSDGAMAVPAQSSTRETWSSLYDDLPEENSFDLAVDTVAQRGPHRSMPPRRSEKDFIGNSRYNVDGKTSRDDPEDTAPLRLPYTTPASEFLYGHSVVAAALRARRRKFYKLYIYQSPRREDDKRDLDMRKMALDLAVPVERVTSERLQMLDRMSEGRPHNVSQKRNPFAGQA